jgi:predicted nucleic acid-binding Zn ribbon protein
VFSPAHANAYRDASLVVKRATAILWTAFLPHRDVSTSLGISAAVHLVLLLGIGAAMYEDGEDETDIPELSVQLVTREGPNAEEFTEASMPVPAPEPLENVLDDPGTGEQTLDAPLLADRSPALERIPDVTELDMPAAVAEPAPDTTPLLTTIGSSASEAPVVVEHAPAPAPAAESMREPEQVMLARNVKQLATRLLDTNTTATTLSWQQDGQQYSARVMRQPAADSTGLEQVIAEIVTDKDGKRMKTRLSLKRLAFSHFTQLVNNWDPNIQLHDDVVDGRFHSNSEITLSAANGVKPRFFGKVTTAAHKVTFNSFNVRHNKDVFQGGFETKTDRVTLPRDMPDVVNGGGGGGDDTRRSFTDDTRIIFNADGSYVWRLANGDGDLQRSAPSEQPQYLIAEKGVKLYVRGTVRGIFTVYSPSDIEIEDDLVYHKDPRQTVMSRDFLALISGDDIKVARTSVTGPGDLNVHAALFARRSFFTEEIDRGKPATLFIYGSLTAGSVSATEPRYATKLDFDKRFEYLRPASFPMTRRYEVDSWDQDWQEIQGAENDLPAGNLARSE